MTATNRTLLKKCTVNDKTFFLLQEKAFRFAGQMRVSTDKKRKGSFPSLSFTVANYSPHHTTNGALPSYPFFTEYIFHSGALAGMFPTYTGNLITQTGMFPIYISNSTTPAGSSPMHTGSSTTQAEMLPMYIGNSTTQAGRFPVYMGNSTTPEGIP